MNVRVLFVVASLFLAVTLPAAEWTPAQIADAYGKIPLRFERNEGQTSCEVAYVSRGRRSMLFLTSTEAVLTLRGEEDAVLRLRLLDANPAAAIAGQEPLESRVNYLVGNDRRKWRMGVTTYRRVRYPDVWPGVDLVWHGSQNVLEYDFVVAPGVDPSQIGLEVEGARKLRIDGEGNLVAETAAGDVVQRAPVLYQEGPDGRVPVAGTYELRGRRVSFSIGAYDVTKPLVIDPVLEYSTFLGGSLNEEAFGVAVDAEGNAYVTGPTDSLDFPRAAPLVPEREALVFIAKLNSDGTDLVYSTFLGASNGASSLRFEEGSDIIIATGIAVTANGEACITGGVDNTLGLSNYPVTDNAYQKAENCLGACNTLVGTPGIDAFVTMLSADGTALVYSSFFGGEKIDPQASFDRGDAVAVDVAGKIYIAGVTNSNDLPTKNAFQSRRASSGLGLDAFLAVFDPSQERGNDTLVYSSFIGGREDDHALGLAVDPDRNAYVGGKTRSFDLETKAPAGQTLPPLQKTFQGGQFDGFVAKIDTESEGDSSLTYLTYFGGNGNDRVEAVAVDAFHRAYITGATSSDPSRFPLLNAFDATQRNGEAFVAKLNANGTTLFYSSFLGGDNDNTAEDFEEGTGIAIDDAGNAYVTGNTTAGDTFPVGIFERPLPLEQQGTVFVAKVGASVSATAVPALVYSTTFGGERARARGIAVSAQGEVYIAGFCDDGLPTTPDAFQSATGGGRDAFVAKLVSGIGDTTGVYDPQRNEFQLRNTNTTGPADLVVALGQPGDFPLTGDWDGDGVSDVGVFRPDRSEFLLRLTSGTIVTLIGGNLGDLPVAGDWDNDGFDTIGIFRDGGRVGQSFFLTNTRVQASPSPDLDIIVAAGQSGDLPLAGDWNGDGLDTVGFFRPSTNTFFQIDDHAAGVVRSFVFGVAGDLPLAGDWDGNGLDDVGVYRSADRTMRLTTDFGVTEGIVFELQAGGTLPFGGNWDGQ